MANKISVIIDASVDKAVAGFKGFKASINDADGAVGKFKAGASSAFDSIKAQAGNLAMVAGAALVTFGVKAVAAFQDTALAAGKFADATGLSTETASRWTAVADDIGISSEAMEKSFGKLAVSVGKNNPLLEEYGITVKKGADGQDDMNATMLHAIDVINSIQDPTKKAAVAQAALGKGWMDMAELIQQGSGSLTDSMAEVSEAQVIDPKEVEKARKMRESLDNLQDSLRDVALVMGEDLVPMAAAAADALTTVIGPLSDLNQLSKNVALGFLELTHVIDDQNQSTEGAAIGIGRMGSALDETADAEERASKIVDDMKAAIEGELDATVRLDAVIDALKAAIDAQREASEEAKREAKEHTEALEDQKKATDDLYESKTALVGGDIAVRDSQREAAAAVAELNTLIDEGKASTDELAASQDNAAAAILGAAQAATDDAIAQAELTGATVSGQSANQMLIDKLNAIASTLAPGSDLRQQIQGYIDELNAIPSEVKTSFTISARGATVTPLGDTIGYSGARAGGGPVRAGHTYLVGEHGPEPFTPAMNGFITPHSAVAAGWGGGSSSAAAAGDTYAPVVNNNGRDFTVADMSRALTLARLSR